jgi:hypothetical protein
MKIFDQPFDENFMQSPVPLLVKLKRIILGAEIPGIFVRYVFYINSLIGVIFLVWHLLGGASVFFRSLIFNQKQIQVDQLISANSQKLGYTFDELIWALKIHHIIASFLWLGILVSMVLFWRRDPKTIIYLLFLFLVYFLQGIYFFGWAFITKELTPFDWSILSVFMILVLIDKVLPIVIEKD